MVKAVVENSAAGTPHPDDPSLRIPLVSQVSKAGLPDPSMEGSHVYGRDSSGNIITDTWTLNNGDVYVKSFSWTDGMLAGKSDWVKQ